jgi:peptidoglycan/LPS O-acetylase OafA/YrhL
MKNGTRHLELIDHLRGVAILAVLVVHTLGMAFGYDALPWKGWFRDFTGQTSFLYFQPISMLSQAGVAIFFAVSGFCIHLSFETQGKRWGGFYIRRFFRIYPPYFLALLFSVTILAINPGVDLLSWDFWWQLLSHAGLIHNFDPATNSGINAALWSLAVEAQLYVLYPLLLALVARLNWGKALGLLAAGELLIRGLDGGLQSMGATDSVAGHVSALLANSPLGYWFSWAIGAAIADAWLEQKPLPLANTPLPLWLGLAVACHFVRPLQPFQFMLFAVTSAAVTARCLNGGNFPLRWPTGAKAVLRKIGLWSYSLYLLHQPLLHVYSHLIVWAVPAEYRPASASFALVMVTWLPIIALCALWYELIERPGIALGKRLIQARMKSANLPERDQATATAGEKTQRQSVVVVGMMTFALVALLAASLFTSYEFSVRAAMHRGARAWTLATSPDAGRRNGGLAVKLAEDACLQTQYRQPALIATLAAAYGEAGRFEEAIGAAQSAGKMAAGLGEEPLQRQCEAMVADFRRHEPFRDLPADGH